MHGLGNDFVVIDGRDQCPAVTPSMARAIADRHSGIGCDQIILVSASDVADARMRIWNADGSEVESCGNATRCVVSLLGGTPRIETAGGIICADSDGAGGAAGVSVRFPPPVWDWQGIPLAYPVDTLSMPVGWEGLETPIAVNVGNPHVVFFVADCDAVELDRVGPLVEHDPIFPDRINVNVATITGPSHIRLRVWERGVGLTRACGTGAMATAVAAIRTRRAASPVTVSLPGGDLVIEWDGAGEIRMSGPATHVFDGIVDWDNFA